MEMVKRYDYYSDSFANCCCCVEEEHTGDWVKWDDYKDLLDKYNQLIEYHSRNVPF